MPSPYEPAVIEPRQGGDLITQFSNENVGAANYTVKRDWRRYQDAEIRREGDAFFAPNTAIAVGTQCFPMDSATGVPITLVHTARKGNGKIATIVGTRTALYRYYSFEDGHTYTSDVYVSGVYEDVSGNWIRIANNLSANGHRWEAVDVAGQTYFNNGVDLPLVYDLNWLVALPVYELREQGVACVDTIENFNGMLFCADTSNMTSGYLTECLTGTSSGATTANQAGYFVTAAAPFFTSSMVGQTIIWSNGFEAKIISYLSTTQVITDTAYNFSSLLFTVAILYGVASDTTRISRNRYQILNSDVGAGRNFGAVFTGSAVTGSYVINLNTPGYSLQLGDQVLVSGIGINGSAVTTNVVGLQLQNNNSVMIDQASVNTNTPFTFSVLPSNLANEYQWNFNGKPITGANSNTYTIQNVQDFNAGFYSCSCATPLSGSPTIIAQITSSPAELIVLPANGTPVILTQPQSHTVLAGNPMALQVIAAGTPTPTYQWTFNGVEIPGATTNLYAIDSTQEENVGTYFVTVTNAVGAVVSNLVNVKVVSLRDAKPPTVIINATNQTSPIGGVAEFSVVMSTDNTPDITYLWFFGGSPLAEGNGVVGTKTPKLRFTCVQANNAQGNTTKYQCVMSNAMGGAVSALVTLTSSGGYGGPSIDTQPIGGVVQGGYPVILQKASYPAGAMGSQDIQTDGSAILRLKELQGRLMVMKETGIIIGTFTGVNTAPMQYQIVYNGPDNLFWKWMLTTVDGTYLLYATQKDFFTFDLSTLLPRKHPKLRLCSNLFYGAVSSISAMNQCFAANNELTREVWLMWPSSTPDKGIAYDYEFETCSTLTVPYTSAGVIEVPSAGVLSIPDRNFLLGGADGTVLSYGYNTGQQGIWTRRGTQLYDSTLTSGFVSFGDEFNQKDLWAYVPFVQKLAPITITLFSANVANGPKTLLFTQTIPTPDYQTLIPTYFRANYFQDQIVVTGSALDSHVVRRIFDPAKVDNRSSTKTQTT